MKITMNPYLFSAIGLCVLAAPVFAFPTRVTPVNSAEAIFAPFWDSALREKSQWNVENGSLADNWCNVGYHADGAFRMVRREAVDVAGYDQLLLSMSVPVGGTLSVTLATDAGTRTQSWSGTSPYRAEYGMALDGAKRIDSITIEVKAKAGAVSGVFYFLGLRDGKALEAMLERTRKLAAQPLDVFLAPPDQQPSFRPRVGLFGGRETIRAAQKTYGDKIQPKPGLPEPFASYSPEKNFRTTVNSANARMFSRSYDEDQRQISLEHMVQRAVLERNPELMRLAVRCAVLLALTPEWDAALSFFPDSAWEQRPFAQTVIAYDLAAVLEFGSDLLSAAGRDLIARRLAESGIGSINYAMWKYKYLRDNNQFVVFSTGRIAAMLALEKQFNNDFLPTYTDLAYRELCGVLDRLIQPDGGFLEGVGYFGYTVGCARPALAVYASARGKTPLEVAPESMRRLGGFGDVFYSTDRRGGMIPQSSSQGEGRAFSLYTAQFLAALCPQSQWVRFYHESQRRRDYAPVPDLASYALERDVPQSIPELPPIAEVPSMGVAASTRNWNGQLLKIVMLGGKGAYFGHRHQDKGSFVLEFAGDTYAADLGGQLYAASDSNEMKRADRHNMLVPVRGGDADAADSPSDIRPAVKGDATAFSGSVNPVAVWPMSMDKWLRTIESPTPERIVITDEYSLKQGDGVNFYWLTQLPFTRLSEDTIRLDGLHSSMTVKASSGVTFSSDTLTVRGKDQFTRLCWFNPAKSGTIRLEITLSVKPDAPKYLDPVPGKMCNPADAAKPSGTAFDGTILADGKASAKLSGAALRQTPHAAYPVADWDRAGSGVAFSVSGFEPNWSEFKALQFSLCNPGAEGGEFMVVLNSNEPGTQGNYYFKRFPLDFKGWRTFTVPFSEFGASRNPVGWDQVDDLVLATRGWGMTPVAGLKLAVDKIRLIR